MSQSSKKIETYKVEGQDFDVILNANENAIDFSKTNLQLTHKIQEAISHINFNRYPDANCTQLRQKYGKYIGVDPQNIVCGNGSDEFISLIIHAFTSKGDTVVYHDPTFSMYRINCDKHGCSYINVPDKENFEIDIDGIISTVNENDAKIIFICNPNNPTGSVVSRGDIIRVLESCNALVVVDEAYVEFYGKSVCDLIDEYDNLIVMRTMSKAFGLAGARVGFAISNADIVTTLNSVRFPYNLNAMSQCIASIYLDFKDEILQEVENMKKRREFLYDELSKFSFLQPYKGQSNFLYIKSDYIDKIKTCAKAKKIALRFFDNEYFRVTIGTEEENNLVISIMKELEHEIG